MTIHDWIKWAFQPADVPHRFASFILARQASRDLGTEVTVPEFEAAMAQAGFAVHHRNLYGSAHYLAADTMAKRTYEFRRYILVDPISHPLDKPIEPDPCAAFKAMSAVDQTTALQWIKTCLVPIRRTRTVSQLKYPLQVVTGLALGDEQMRGALLSAGIETTGHRFRCCLSNEALLTFRRARRAQQQEISQ